MQDFTVQLEAILVNATGNNYFSVNVQNQSFKQQQLSLANEQSITVELVDDFTGYLKLTGSFNSKQDIDKLIQQLSPLSNVDSLIIDLRFVEQSSLAAMQYF